MTAKCRAKNPNACRVHGNPTVQDLQKQADQAAVAGNMTEYFKLREQIDTAIDTAQTNTTNAYPLDDETLSEGSHAWHDTIKQWQRNMVTEQSPEEDRLIMTGVKHTVKRALQAADEHMPEGKITPRAIEAAGDTFYNEYYKNKPTDAKSNSPYFRSIGKAVLEATRQK